MAQVMNDKRYHEKRFIALEKCSLQKNTSIQVHFSE